MARKGEIIDIAGQRFGRLLVIEFVHTGKGTSRGAIWKCRCDCGGVVNVPRNKLVTGHTQSCGCLQKERASRAQKTHGRSNSSLYKVWAAMIRRCENQNDRGFNRYGGRGIRVCERWRNSFEAFVEDMGERPQGRFSIERKENGGNYEPGNCVWATPVEQGRNKRTNRVLEWNGEKRCLAEWADIVGIQAYVIKLRLRRGWSVGRALSEPVHVVSKGGKGNG